MQSLKLASSSNIDLLEKLEELKPLSFKKLIKLPKSTRVIIVRYYPASDNVDITRGIIRKSTTFSTVINNELVKYKVNTSTTVAAIDLKENGGNLNVLIDPNKITKRNYSTFN